MIRPIAQALAAPTLLLLAACAADVGDVDRTQPNRVKKSLFEGEWYHQKTTFDVPFTAGFTFIGETSTTERVRWQVERNYLIAYRSYDLVENTQAVGTLPDVDFKGAPIAAYAITSHFDIVRDYNSLTGEETNLIIENDFDRPWNEREYMRVDWSKNLVVSFDFLDDQVEQSPIAYWVEDRTDEDRVLVGVKTADGWQDHQDWEAIAALDSADYIDIVDTIFANPASVAFDDGLGGVEAYPECWFYGATDCQPSRVKIRSAYLKVDPSEGYEALAYPDNAPARAPNGDAIRDEFGDVVRIPYFDRFGYFRVERDFYDRDRERTEHARTFLINRWNIWQSPESCRVGESYAACAVKPIVYYLSPGFPAALEPVAARSVEQWNLAFKEVVRQLKYGGQRALADVEDVVVLAKNDYVPGVSRGQRIGDLRYSFLYWVQEPQAVGPLGYGPSAVDPISGRILQASAYVYGAGLESWTAFGADVVGLINGQIASDQLIEGEDVMAALSRLRGDYAAHVGELRTDEARRFASGARVKRGRAKQKALGKRGLRLDHGEVRAKLQAIEGTAIEERLLTDELVRALVPAARGTGTQLVAGLSPAEKRRISPARWGTRGAARAREARRRLKIQKANLMMARHLDDAVLGLAERLKGETDRARVKAEILARVFESTAEHEIGHTLGLRHNFGGSYDALNYPKEYWDLRGPSPQPLERPTEAQLRGGLRELQYASIMDYGARFTSDIRGIGHYDHAAILFGYGGLIEVFERAPSDPLVEAFGPEYALHNLRHYTSYPRLFGGVDSMYARRVVPYTTLVDQWTGRATTDYVEVPYRFCSDEYEGALNWCNTWDDGADPYEIVRNASDAYEDYYVFRSFSRDRRELDPWGHMDSVYWRYFSHAQNQYQQWVFRGWDEGGLWESLRADDAAGWGIEDVDFDQAIDGGLAGAAASRLGLSFLSRVIQAPEPGAYYVDPVDNTFYNYSYDADEPLCPPNQSLPDCSDLNVEVGDGKYALSLFRGETGYYFYERIHVIGSFYDKLAALQTLTSPETNFLGVDSDANLTQYAIGMNLYFPDEVTRLVGGSAVDAYGAFAGVVQNQRYVPRDPFAPAAQYAGLPAVDPATSFTIELYAAWLGMAFLNASFDNSFNDLMRIFVEGSGEGLIPAVDDPARVARFVHPRTGRAFVAIRHVDPEVFSPGFEIVQRMARDQANAELDPAEREFRVESAVSIVETIRGLNELYGKLYF